MKNQALVRQLIEAKKTKNEEAYEIVYEEIIEEIENLCCTKFTNDDVTKETIMMMSKIMKAYSKSLKEHAESL